MVSEPQLKSWPSTRQATWNQIEAFLPRAAEHYRDNRNFDEGPGQRQHVSLLSPMLRLRIVSELELIGRVVAVHGWDQGEKYLQEVLWRAYWRAWLEVHPDLWASLKRELASTEEARHQNTTYRKALSATTGIAAFDCWVVELQETGYLHNHARLWFASIWIFTLGLPWSWGADFFLRHLLDGDSASNTLSWRWVAGLHTKGKVYAAKGENIERFTGGRFAPLGLNEKPLAAKETLDMSTTAPPEFSTWNADECEGKKIVLINAGDDLSIDQLKVLRKISLVQILSIDPMCLASNSGTSESVCRYRQLALSAAEQRWRDQWRCSVDRVISSNEYLPITMADHILILESHVGPYRDMLAQLTKTLPQSPITRLQRRFDGALRPLATKGFFDFWRAAQPIVASLLESEEDLWVLTKREE